MVCYNQNNGLNVFLLKLICKAVFLADYFNFLREHGPTGNEHQRKNTWQQFMIYLTYCHYSNFTTQYLDWISAACRWGLVPGPPVLIRTFLKRKYLFVYISSTPVFIFISTLNSHGDPFVESLPEIVTNTTAYEKT